jgi:hypothetical protein
MGLFAVSRLAARHGIRVRLRAGNPQGLTALVWLPGNLTSREQPLAVGMHSRPRPEGSTFNEITSFGDDPTPALGAALQAAHGTSGLRQRTTGRPGGGRHRLSLLATSGDQPVVGGGAGPRSVWFAAKTPSGRAPAGSSSASSTPFSATSASSASSASADGGQRPTTPGRGWGAAGVDWSASGSADAGMRSADPGGWPGGGSPTGPPATRQTQAGLPQRVPRSTEGLDGPPSGYDASRPDEAPVLGAPAGPGTGAQGGWGAGAPRPGTQPSQRQGTDQQTARRRSPEAARNRLAGFQLGNRDATQAGSAPGWTPYEGEETSR